MSFVTCGLTAAFLAGAVLLASPAEAQSRGDRVTCTATVFTCSPAAAAVGGGVEFTFGASPAVPFLGLDFSGNLLDISGRQTSIQFGAGTSLSFRDTTSAFASATLLASSNTTLTASDVRFNNGVVTVNLAGRQVNAASRISIGLTTLASAVPEPATWAMMTLGVGAVGFSMRRRRGASVPSLVA